LRTTLVFRRVAAAGAIALGTLLSNTVIDTEVVVPVSGQQPERLPGPIIEDPPGEFAGYSYVRPAQHAIAPGAALSTFQVTYNGFSPQAQSAFQAAVDVWASQIQSSVPIRITANWTTLGANVLGSAGATYVFRNFPGAPLTNVWYGAALAKKLSGSDLTAGLANSSDIVANFNSGFSWYYGTDGNPGTQFDLMSVVLHELGHGLGVFGSMTASGGVGAWGFSSSPLVFDLSAINGSSQALVNTSLFPNPSVALGSQLVSNSIFLNGTNARTSNGGIAPKLYAPDFWSAGSSFSHLDEATYPAGNANSLMTPMLAPGEAIHDLGPIVRGLFGDIGWTVVPPSTRRRTRGDIDGDGKSDVAVFRPASGVWYTLLSSTNNTTYAAYAWGGLSTDTSVPADYDGDGKTDLGIYRDGTWYVLLSSTNFTTYRSIAWGASADVPVPGDYDGDGKADFAVYRPSTGYWYVLTSSTSYTAWLAQQWGAVGDRPVHGDYDGDGKVDFAIYRPSTAYWYVLTSSTGYTAWLAQQWGTLGDRPVPSDYDGDGKVDFAIYRPSSGTWIMLKSSSNNTAWTVVQWGVAEDVSVPADYDGDGLADVAIYRPSAGTWWILKSSSGNAAYNVFQWGVSTDVAVGGFSQ
jgi:hypothetical protein